MILADSSALVEYLRHTGSEVDKRVEVLIASSAPLATTEPVRMEMMSGARNRSEEALIDRLLRGFELARFDGVDFEGAARIYRRCRSKGVTPRSLIDCMIASVAMRHRAAVLAHDTDFSLIAGVVALELDPATRTQ